MPMRVVLGLLLCVVGGWTTSAEDLAAPQTRQPIGEYRTAMLRLERAWEGSLDLPVFVGFRDGQGTTAWLIANTRKDAHRLWVDRNTLRLSPGTLAGEIQGRMVKVWAPIAETGDYSLQLTARLDGNNVTGSYTGRFGTTTVEGSLRGTLCTETLRGDNALARNAGWTDFVGQPQTTELLDDLTQSRPGWKAEESLPCMWGRGPEDRYPQRACMVGCDGGASSPVVSEGRVFVYYFRPTGAPGSSPLSYGAGVPKYASEAEIIEFAKKHSANPLAHQSMVDWFRPFADDVIVAFDAATGQTLWKTVLPDRSGNHQAHKWRGMNPTPTVVGDTIYVQGYGGRLYALDATTGRVQWEYGDAATKRIGSRGVPSGMGPIVSGDVVVFAVGNETIAIDRKTGTERWKKPGRYPLVWNTSDGATRLIVLGSDKSPFDKIDCLDFASGERLWSAPVALYSGMSASTTAAMALIAGDMLVGMSPSGTAGAKPTGAVPRAWKLSSSGATQAWEGEFLPNDENEPLTRAGDRVYVQGREEIRAYELATGRLLATARGKEAFGGQSGPGSNPWLAVSGQRILLNPEGQHGDQRFMLLDTNLKLLSTWTPPHTSDSAYACMPVASPVVDGRVFIRGQDGLYCYDLRKVEPRVR